MKYDVGYKFTSKEGFEYEVIEVLKDSLRIIRTTKSPIFTTTTRTPFIRDGIVRNPYSRNVFGRGYIGEGMYNSKNAKINGKDFYDTWSKMFDRCYRGVDLTYSNVDVCEEWYNFQNFMDYVEKTFPIGILDEKFVLDKDLLQKDSNFKIYSKDTCVWIPKRINSYIQNKRSGTNNKHKGINKDYNQWVASSTLFEKGGIKFTIGYFYNLEEAINAYKEFKLSQDSKARQYVRDLNYLPEEIIQLIRTV